MDIEHWLFCDVDVGLPVRPDYGAEIQSCEDYYGCTVVRLLQSIHGIVLCIIGVKLILKIHMMNND